MLFSHEILPSSRLRNIKHCICMMQKFQNEPNTYPYFNVSPQFFIAPTCFLEPTTYSFHFQYLSNTTPISISPTSRPQPCIRRINLLPLLLLQCKMLQHLFLHQRLIIQCSILLFRLQCSSKIYTSIQILLACLT
jgi:hypothetical protein